ncbi:hypothetical protein LPJ58_002325 [Coemansia sp. RSA 1591]|nr:hypothetical protein LPJ58_002325 [Coemansia sp. RSA 1591]KAJ1763785.1 hypothetical protein LPJ69_002246 [Coemansia sp. RSA 1752]KAJ1790209.1 hypothetical protein LPJ67_002232 [Coemansia sp. RSA 1938]KAJ2142418.1 hypothetical protein IW142_004313 [Coemansia sp. RSA 564]KAJ2436555.1 hypothetical protein IWW41_000010 [Coemansia sp. RSA 2522]
MYKGGLHPGKAGQHIQDGGCSIGWGHKEVNVREYQVLCGDASKLRWVKQEGALSVQGFKPVDAGHEETGEPLYVAKAMYDGSQQLGKCAPHIKKGMAFAYGHKERTTDEYMVLAHAYMEFLLRTQQECTRAPTRAQVMIVYRGILKNARMFFDDTTREFIQTYAKQKFRTNLHDSDVGRARKKLTQSTTALHLLERANKGVFTDVISVLEYGYGRKGPRKPIMLEATVGIGRREQVFGTLHEVEKYRPAFFALASYQLGRDKLTVSSEALKSTNPLNIAKAQDAHWARIQHRLLPPIDASTMTMLEDRANTGTIVSAARLACSDAHTMELVEEWERVWIKVPEARSVRRYYRRLLESVVRMDVTTRMVDNPGKYEGNMARRSAIDTPKPDLIPERIYAFVESSMAGHTQPSHANSVDCAGLD